MSFKAHDGFRLSDKLKNESIGKLQSHLINLKQEFKFEFDKAISFEILKQTIKDENLEESTDISSSFFKNARKVNLKIEFGFISSKNEVLVLPFSYQDETEEFVSLNIPAISNSVHSILMKILHDSEEFEEFGYWDDVDPDENCTEEEWEYRKQEWESAIEWGVPTKEIAFFYSMYELDIVNWSKIIKDGHHVIDNKKRAWNKALSEALSENTENELSEENRRAITHFMLNSKDDGTEENKLVKEKMEQITLPPVYFRETLVSEGWN